MNLRYRVWIPALLIGMALSAGCARESAQVSYSKDVAPLLERYCQACHVPGQIGYESSGFEVKDYESLMKGTKYGAVILAGEPMTSALIMLIEGRADPSIKMPHAGAPQMSASEIETIHRWVEQGAKNN